MINKSGKSDLCYIDSDRIGIRYGAFPAPFLRENRETARFHGSARCCCARRRAVFLCKKRAEGNKRGESYEQDHRTSQHFQGVRRRDGARPRQSRHPRQRIRHAFWALRAAAKPRRCASSAALRTPTRATCCSWASGSTTSRRTSATSTPSFRNTRCSRT